VDQQVPVTIGNQRRGKGDGAGWGEHGIDANRGRQCPSGRELVPGYNLIAATLAAVLLTLLIGCSTSKDYSGYTSRFGSGFRGYQDRDDDYRNFGYRGGGPGSS
jgi:hypothetical protein